jgi:DNA-directed RNA polymerase subunit D
MNLQILSLKGNIVRFLVEGVGIAFANAIRRTTINEVPCMAIEDIFIFDNSSVIPDEVIAHRIGFIPIETDLNRFNLPYQCDCESELGCEKCRVVFTLDVQTETSNRTVYSSDLVSEDPRVKPISSDIVIAKLAPGQAIRLEAYAQLGIGKDHAKWQPVSNATYQHISEIEIDQKRCTACAACVEACPSAVLSLEIGKLRVLDIYSCTLCSECVKACPVEPSAVTQGFNVDAFLFTVESTGCLPPERIVKEAVKILMSKLDEFSEKIEKNDTQDEIKEFEVEEQEGRRLYSIGTGDFEEEDEE